MAQKTPHRMVPTPSLPGANKPERYKNRKTYPLREEEWMTPNQKSAKEAFEKFNNATTGKGKK